MLNWRIGLLGGRGFRSSVYSRSTSLPCKEEFGIGCYGVSFETSPPDENGGGGSGVVLTTQYMKKEDQSVYRSAKTDQSLSKVFSTVCASPLLPDVTPDSSPRLKVDYQGNQLPCNDRVGLSFARRESARIIRTPMRPLFPAHFYHDVEVMARVICCDGEQDTDVMAANATSAALMLSDIPWGGPIGVVRIARLWGDFIINPTKDELFDCDLDLVYACTRDHKTLMADVHACEVTEKDLEEALQLAHQQAIKYLSPQIILAEKAGKHKKDYTLTMLKDSTIQKIMSSVEEPCKAFISNSENKKRTFCMVEGEETLVELTEDVKRILDLQEQDKEKIKVIPKIVDLLKKKAFQRLISEKALRVDGRRLDEVRKLKCESTKMSESQGSSLFACGPTQVICTVPQRRPGDDEAENLGDDLLRRVPRYLYKSRPFRVHGNWKVGDCDSYDACDGNFVEKALVGLLPVEFEFPYVVLLNSQAKHFDGSVSTAAVCGGSIALMVSGVPLKKPVAGVSVGTVSEVHPTDGKLNNYQILTDLSSLEEHLVDMNFKVAGSRDGITAIQLDVNVAGVPLGIICECLGPALKGRLEILDRMEQEISAPDYCTSDDWGWSDATIVTYRLPVKSIELLNEPDGAWQRDFERETGARISMVEDDRDITVAVMNKTSHMLAKQKLETVTGNEIEVRGLHEDGVTHMKSYVEIPIKEVDQLPDQVHAVERQELTYISCENQLRRRLKFDRQIKICVSSEHYNDELGGRSELYDSELSDSELSDSKDRISA